MRKKAKLVDLARAAGVSLATVSRVATGSARVSPEVADRIRRAAQQLGADLRKSKVIAFLLSNRNVLHPFHSHILVGAELHSAARGWNMLFMTFRYTANVAWPELHIPQILERRDTVGGVVIGGINSRNLLEVLKHRNIPYAVLGNSVVGDWKPEEHDVVWVDDRQGAFEMTQYLQSLGHKNIWYVGNMSLPWNVRRYESYARAMEEAGLSPRQSSVESDSDEDIGYLAAKAILASDEAVSAIFAGSDSVVEGVYQALRDCNLSVPQHISVAGFDDVGATSLYPPLTTVHVFTEQLGKHLAELVLKRIEFPDLPPQKLLIPTQLVKRQSCQQHPGTTRATTDPVIPEATLAQSS